MNTTRFLTPLIGFRRIFYGGYIILLVRLLSALSKARMPRVAALVLALGVPDIRKSWALLPDQRLSLWVLSKTGLNEDMATVVELEGGSRFRLVSIDRRITKAIAGAFLSCRTEREYPSAVSGDQLAQRQLRAFWMTLIHTLQRTTRIDLIVSGNWRFWEERDLAAAASACRIPFVVLHKESFKTAAQQRAALSAYRNAGSFSGAHILTYNQTEKDLLAMARVVDPAQITVTGAPRLDVLHRFRRSEGRSPPLGALPSKLKVVCFAVSPHAGLVVDTSTPPDHDGAARLRFWADLAEHCLSIWREAARRRPQVEFVVKTKVGALNSAPALAWWSTHEIPCNMTLAVGGVATDILRDASAACGFNTTALLDALARGLPVGVIRYAPAGTADPDVLHDYAGVASVLTDLGSTLDWIDAIVEMPPASVLPPQAALLLERTVGNPDGCAGSRVQAELLRIWRATCKPQ